MTASTTTSSTMATPLISNVKNNNKQQQRIVKEAKNHSGTTNDRQEIYFCGSDHASRTTIASLSYHTSRSIDTYFEDVEWIPRDSQSTCCSSKYYDIKWTPKDGEIDDRRPPSLLLDIEWDPSTQVCPEAAAAAGCDDNQDTRSFCGDDDDDDDSGHSSSSRHTRSDSSAGSAAYNHEATTVEIRRNLQNSGSCASSISDSDDDADHESLDSYNLDDDVDDGISLPSLPIPPPPPPPEQQHQNYEAPKEKPAPSAAAAAVPTAAAAYDDDEEDMRFQELVCATATTTIEVAPGLDLPLRGANESYEAIEQGFFSARTCPVCSTVVACMEDADYMLCPDCKTITSIQHHHDDSVVLPAPCRAAGAPPRAGGVGLGLRFESLLAADPVVSGV